MVLHLIGVDSAGHTFHSLHGEIERKLKDTEKIIEQIVEKMDDQTTLLVFGGCALTHQPFLTQHASLLVDRENYRASDI